MIVLGRITAPYGVEGWVRVHPFGDDPLAWRRMPQWWLGDQKDWKPYALAGCREHGGSLIARFDGIADRAGAEGLIGLYVAAPREALPDAGKDEFYWADLIGLAVVNEQGVALGRVKELISTGANDVLCVSDGDHERLLPFIEQVVKAVDVAGGAIRVDWQPDW